MRKFVSFKSSKVCRQVNILVNRLGYIPNGIKKMRFQRFLLFVFAFAIRPACGFLNFFTLACDQLFLLTSCTFVRVFVGRANRVTETNGVISIFTAFCSLIIGLQVVY